MKALKSTKKSRNQLRKITYKKYNFDQRQALIKMVVNDKRSLSTSAQYLGICQTTARLIISTWNQEERVFQKKTDREKRLLRQKRKQKRMELKQKLARVNRGRARQRIQDGVAETLNIQMEDEIPEIPTFSPVREPVSNEGIPIIQSVDTFNFYPFLPLYNSFGLPIMYYLPNPSAFY